MDNLYDNQDDELNPYLTGALSGVNAGDVASQPQIGMGALSGLSAGDTASQMPMPRPQYLASNTDMAVTPEQIDPSELVKQAISQRTSLGDRVAQARGLASNNQLAANLGEAGSDIANAFSGGRLPKSNFYDNLRSTANQPVQQINDDQKLSENDPDSPQSKVYKGILLQTYGKELNLKPEDLEGMSAAQAKELATILGQKTALDTKQLIAQGNNATKLAAQQAGAGNKLDASSNKRLTELSNKLDPNGQRSGEFGRQQQVVNNADRVLVLSKQFPDLNFPKTSMAELASASAALVSGGNHAAEGTINRFVPATVGSSAAGIEQWLTNDPKGTNQQAFVKQMIDTAQRERDLAASKVKDTKLSRVASYKDLQNHPQFNSVLQSQGIDPSELQAYEQNGYKVPAAGPIVTPGGGLSSTADPKIQDYATQNKLDYAKAAKILKDRGYNGQ